ncbi:hypothetical protein ACLB2K_050763 [Fragaria x ananassa]
MRHGDADVEKLHKKEFVDWFSMRIEELYEDGEANEHMMSLANGPEFRAKHYPIYNVHGFRFHTSPRDVAKQTQNDGVMVKGEGHTEGCVPWYGKIKDIIELRYTKGNRVFLFNCHWYDTATE